MFEYLKELWHMDHDSWMEEGMRTEGLRLLGP